MTCKIIAVLNNKGGSGKTTTALNLLYQGASRFGYECLAVDLDQQRNLTETLLEERPKIGVFDLIIADKWVELPSKVLAQANASFPNVRVLAADERLANVGDHMASMMGKDYVLKSLLDPLKKVFDLIVIDVPPGWSALSLNALVAADAFITPTDPSEFGLSGCRTIREYAARVISKKLNPNLIDLGVVVAGYQKASSLVFKDFLKQLEEDFEVLATVPHRVSVPESIKQKTPIPSNNDVAAAYRKLADKLFKEV